MILYIFWALRLLLKLIYHTYSKVDPNLDYRNVKWIQKFIFVLLFDPWHYSSKIASFQDCWIFFDEKRLINQTTLATQIDAQKLSQFDLWQATVNKLIPCSQMTWGIDLVHCASFTALGKSVARIVCATLSPILVRKVNVSWRWVVCLEKSFCWSVTLNVFDVPCWNWWLIRPHIETKKPCARVLNAVENPGKTEYLLLLVPLTDYFWKLLAHI